MKDFLVSIIVPIYNVEKYLDECIESLVNQSYKNLEIILVDDGSPDHSPEICDIWALKDDRIIVIHKENGGLSDARNYGLRKSTGNYITFVDSDDVVSIFFIEKLLKIMIKNKVDICECNYSTIKNDFNDITTTSDIRCYDTRDALEYLFNENIFKHVVWNKMYKREIIEDLEFEKDKIHEDLFFTYLAFGKSKNIAKISDNLYFYRQRDNSIMSSKFSIKNLDAIEARMRQLNYIKINFPDLINLVTNCFLISCLYFMQIALETKNIDLIKQTERIIKPQFKTINKKRKFKLNLKQEIWYRLASISFFACCKLRNKLKIGL